jgi:hypothetical protein
MAFRTSSAGGLGPRPRAWMLPAPALLHWRHAMWRPYIGRRGRWPADRLHLVGMPAPSPTCSIPLLRFASTSHNSSATTVVVACHRGHRGPSPAHRRRAPPPSIACARDSAPTCSSLCARSQLHSCQGEAQSNTSSSALSQPLRHRARSAMDGRLLVTFSHLSRAH